MSQGRTNIYFSLQSTETRIVKFSASRKSANNESHVIWSSDSVLGYYVDSGKVWAKAVASDSATSVKLSSGKTVTLDQKGQSQFSLGNWSVVLEQWLPPDNLYDVETVANKKNVSLSVSGFSLSRGRISDIKIRPALRNTPVASSRQRKKRELLVLILSFHQSPTGLESASTGTKYLLLT